MSATSSGELFQRIPAVTRVAAAAAEAVETIRIIAVEIVTMIECKLLVPFFSINFTNWKVVHSFVS